MIPAAFVILCAVRLSMSLTAESSVLNNAAKSWSAWDSLPGAPQLNLSDDGSAQLPLPLTFLQEASWNISNNGYLNSSKVTVGIYGCDLVRIVPSEGIYYKALTKLYDGVWRQVVVISYVTTRYSSSSAIVVQGELWDDGGVVLRYNSFGNYTLPCSGGSLTPMSGAFLMLAGFNVSFAPQQGLAYYYSGRSVRAAYCAACGAACGMCVCPVGRYCPSNATTSLPCPHRSSRNVRGNTALSDCQTMSPTMSPSLLSSATAVRSASFSRSPSNTIFHSRLPMPAVSATAQAVVSSSQALSAMSGSPASASTMARLSGAMSAASCAQAIDSSSVAQSTDKVKSLFPIQFYDSSSPNDDIVNSLLANYIFVAAFATVVVLIALCVSLAAHVTVREVLLHLRWPSVLFPAIVATLPSGVGTIGAFLTRATTSALLPEDWAPCLIACATGVVMWLGFCVWVTVVCVRGSWLLEPQLKEEEVTFVDKLKRCDTSWFRDFLRIVFQSQWMWSHGKAHSSALGAPAKAELDAEKALFDEFLSSNASVFTELRVTWFTSLDVWVTLLSSVVNAIPLTSVRGCVSVAATNVVLALVLLVIAAAARPFGSRFGTVQLLLMQMGTFVCACCVFAYIIIASELLLTVVSYAVLVVGVVSMSRTVVDLVLLFHAAVRLRLFVRTNLGETVVLEGHRQVDAAEDSVVFSPRQEENDDMGMQLCSWPDDDRESPTLQFAVSDAGDDSQCLGDQFWDASGNCLSRATSSPTVLSSDNEKSSNCAVASQRTALETSSSLDDFDLDELLDGKIQPFKKDRMSRFHSPQL